MLKYVISNYKLSDCNTITQNYRFPIIELYMSKSSL